MIDEISNYQRLCEISDGGLATVGEAESYLTSRAQCRNVLSSFEILATKYVGETAENYERSRLGHKWHSEHEAFKQLLSSVPDGATVLDIPIGTGRLLPFFQERRFDTSGIDISPDMLAQARVTAKSIGLPARIHEGDIRSVPFPTNSFDLVACLRFLSLVDERGLELVFAELARLSNDKVLIGIRYVISLTDFRGTPWDFARLMARPVWFARWVFHFLFGYRKIAKAHRQAFVFRAISKFGLSLVEMRHVERRWDSTDYVLLLLQKNPQSVSLAVVQ